MKFAVKPRSGIKHRIEGQHLNADRYSQHSALKHLTHILLHSIKNQSPIFGDAGHYARHTLVTIAKRDMPIASNATEQQDCYPKATITD